MSLQNLFVAKLPRNITDADLLSIFNEFCPSSAKIMLDAGTGKSKGFGFVLFDEEEQGARAYKALNRKMTRACGHSFTLVIYPSNHNGKIFTEESNALYIRNIPMSVGEESLERFLNTFGKLAYFAMRGDHYGNPVWVVYAEYETVQDAKNALTKLHGNSTYFHGSAPILAKFEDSDDAKKERRRRRDGAQAHAPRSGCIFPPPHDHNEKNVLQQTSVGTLSSNNSSADSGGVSNDKAAGLGCCSRGGAYAAAPNLSLSTVPPSESQAPPLPYMTDARSQSATPPFSVQPQLLKPAPAYCCTLTENRQQIFFPATTLNSSPLPYHSKPTPQATPMLFWNPPVQSVEDRVKQNLAVTNPTANPGVVLMEDGRQYMLAPDAVNMSPISVSSPTSYFVPGFIGSFSKNFQYTSSDRESCQSGSRSSTNAFTSTPDAMCFDQLQFVPRHSSAAEDFLCEAGAACTTNDITAPGPVEYNVNMKKISMASVCGRSVIW